LTLASAFASLVGADALAQSPGPTPPNPVPPAAFAADVSESRIAWGGVTADAFVAAHRTGKPILVYVTAEKCAFCRKMERETWSDPQVAKLVEAGYVPLKLHADTHPDEIATLRIRAFPATVLVSPQGKPFAGRVGYVESAKLVELLQPEVAAAPAIRQPAL
jgi:uncharacterized protein YyaL (SSP411 family)